MKDVKEAEGVQKTSTNVVTHDRPRRTTTTTIPTQRPDQTHNPRDNLGKRSVKDWTSVIWGGLRGVP